MRNLLFLFATLVGLLSGNTAYAETTATSPSSINFPLIINDENSKVNFEVDSTWHTVHGKTSKISGELFLENKEDISTLKGQVSIPVKSFNTDNSSRDKKLLKIMAADKFPVVTLNIHNIENLCEPSKILNGVVGQSCSGSINAELKIRDITQKVRFPIKLERTDYGSYLYAEYLLDWASYGVEDPSILIAKVAPEVKILIELQLNKN